MKPQESPGVGTPSLPSEQMIVPLVGAVSDVQVITNRNKAKGLIYTSNYSTLKMCNSVFVRSTDLNFVTHTFVSW